MSNSSANRPVILVTGTDLAPQAVALLDGFELVYAGKAPTEDDLVLLCERHQPVAVIVRYGRITRRIIEACRSLQVISKHGTGIDTIDIAAAAECGIAVKAAAGANAAAVAEHTWALIFGCAKSVVTLDQRMRDGHWDKSTHKSVELKSRTLGLVGLGAIGKRVADVGLALGMSVVAYDPYASAAHQGIALLDLATLLRTADVVSLHCPLTEENRHMINQQSLAQMKNGAILVNSARGGLVDETALAAALKSGKLYSAGLDSFEKEPLMAPHLFQDVRNVILSPHIGGVTTDAYIAMGTGAASNVLAALNTAGVAA
jgi:D-3-phosphoglycerate dehydrogenase / 2-oxoglutarate reductase